MKEVWIKLTKYFQGGSRSTYMLVEPSQIDTKEHQEEIMEEWGENSDGGHSYGYRVDMETLEGNELPPKEWLEKAIINRKSSIEYLKKRIVDENNLIGKYETVLNSINETIQKI